MLFPGSSVICVVGKTINGKVSPIPGSNSLLNLVKDIEQEPV